jgi:peptide deformylase
LIRKIISYPNELLFQDSLDVVSFDNTLHTLLDDMYETMIESNGVGLAGIQVSEKLNILIINLPNKDNIQDKEDLIEAINPIIIDSSGEQYNEEGCLSVPGFDAIVKRYEYIKVQYYNRFGEKIVQNYTEFLAVAWQHEMDHLKGGLFIQKLSILDRKKFKKYLKQR